MPPHDERHGQHRAAGSDDTVASAPMQRAQEAASEPYEVRAAPAGVDPPDLPAAPEIERRVRFRFGQLVGLLLVAAVPVMGLAGMFGTSTTVRVGGDDVVSVSVTYPTVQRHKVRHRLSIEVTNTGSSALASVEVRLSNSYLLAFSDVALTPSPERVDSTDHVFVITDLQPGETQAIVAEMQANSYWTSRGTVRWSTDRDPAVARSGELTIGTLTWP